MTRLVLSSRNKGKLLELQRMLATIAPHIELVSVADFPEGWEMGKQKRGVAKLVKASD